MREPRLAILASVLCLAITSAASAQQAPAAPDAAKQKNDEVADETITLSPFEVSSSKDEGYLASSSLAGSRLNTSLKDIASPISVVTTQFLQDTGATSVQDLLIYTTNTQVEGVRGNYFGTYAQDIGGQNSRLSRPQEQTRVRGLNQADLTRDFWVTSIPLDAYNVNSIEIQRGPNSILYGLGSPAGIINYSLKTPNMSRDRYMVEGRVSNEGGLRGTADLNQVILPNTLAIRLNGLAENQKFSQEGTYSRVKRFTVSPRWTPKVADGVYTEFTVNFEKGQTKANRPLQTPPVDDITPWYSQNVNKYTKPTTTSAIPAEITPYLGNYSGAWPSWYDQIGMIFSDPNSSKTGGNNITDAVRQRGGAVFSSWQYVTNAYDTWSGSNALNQKATFANNPRVMAIINDYEKRSGKAFTGFTGWQAQQILDTSVFDYWHDSLTGPNNYQWNDFHTINISGRQTYFHDRAGIEVVYDKQNFKDGYKNLINDPYTVSIDINAQQPNGAPNPNFLRPYYVSDTAAQWRNEMAENARATAFYKFRLDDFMQKGILTSIIGEQTFTGVLSTQTNTHSDYSYKLSDLGQEIGQYGYDGLTFVHYLNSDKAPATLSSPVGMGIHGVNAVQMPTGTITAQTRYDPGYPTAIPDWSNVTTSVMNENDNLSSLITGASGTRQQIDSKSFIWQSRFLNDTVVGLFGVREDKFSKQAKGTPPLLPQDARKQRVQNPFDPKWTYDPANDLYADATTHSYGIILHSPEFINKHLPWGTTITLGYNHASNFRPNDVGFDIERHQLAAPSGESKDYSVLISTLNDRLTLRATWYKTVQRNTSAQGGPSSGLIQEKLQRTLNGLMLESWSGSSRQNTTPEFIVNKWFFGDTYDKTLANQPLPVAWASADSATRAALLKQPLRIRASALTQPEGTINPATGQAYEEPQITADERAYRAAWFNARTDAEWFRPIGTNLQEAFQFNRIVESDGSANQWTSTGIGSFKNTADIASKGTELELTANITSNWRVAINASRSIAEQTNVLDAAMDRYIAAFKTVALDGYSPTDQLGPVDYWHRTGFAQIDEWGDEGTGGNAQFLGSKWVTNTYVPYLTAKASNGKAISELPKYTVNFITSYDFKRGVLKGFGIGGAVRYTGRYAIGYYPIYDAKADTIIADLDSPIYAKAETSYDLWFSYRHKITSKINGTIQLNLRDLFAGHRLIPISSNPDGTYGQYRMGAPTSWELTTRLEF